jgi:hypothetical protein
MSMNVLSLLTNSFRIIRRNAFGRSCPRICSTHSGVCHGAIGWCDQNISKPPPACRSGPTSGCLRPRRCSSSSSTLSPSKPA